MFWIDDSPTLQQAPTGAHNGTMCGCSSAYVHKSASLPCGLNRHLAGRWFAALNPLSARGPLTVVFNEGIRVCDVDSKEFYTKLFLFVAAFVLVGVV